jgi:CP family cyanate transporter-like MFS transporter
VAGLLGTIPILCMGLFAPPAPFVSGRLGLRRALGGSLALIGAFGLARAAAPGAALLIVLTWPVGIGLGIAGALLYVRIKERFADRPALRVECVAGSGPSCSEQRWGRCSRSR